MERTRSRLHHIVHIHAKPGHYWHPHRHPLHELILVLRGGQRTRFRGRTVTAGPGDVMLYPAETTHEEWAHRRGRMESYCMLFEWEGYDPAFPRLLHDGEGTLRVLAELLYAERQNPSPLEESVCGTLLQAFLAQLVKLWKHAPDDMVAAIRRYVRDRLAEPITLDELAAEAKLSKYHFSRRFKAITDRTPMEEVRILRVEQARNLILSTSLPLKAIPPLTGLGNVYHMSRLFRACLDITPGQLRRPARGE